MNVFIPIDQSWSFKFFEFNRPAIAQIEDFFKFSDEFYEAALLYVTTYINFGFGLTPAKFNDDVNRAMQLCSRYAALGNKIQEAFRRLYVDYRVAYSSLQGVVTRAQPVIDQSGVLIGIVFTVDTTWPPAQQ
jgi:hypothetical protein